MTDRLRNPGEAILASLPGRRRAEARFRLYGIAAIGIALAFLLLLIGAIGVKGVGAFTQTEIALDIVFDESVLDPSGARSPEVLSTANYRALVRAALGEMFPEAIRKRRDRRALAALVSVGAGFELRGMVLEDPGLIGRTLRVWAPADDEVDMLFKGAVERNSGRFTEKQLGWLDRLEEEGRIRSAFNWRFFSSGDSREPELKQNITPGNATIRFVGDGLSVRTPTGGDLVQRLELRPEVFTPNGDGVNDALDMRFVVFKLDAATPTLALYDLASRQVAAVESTPTATGHRFTWTGRDASGALVAPGMYLYRLDLGAESGPGTHTGAISVVY